MKVSKGLLHSDGTCVLVPYLGNKRIVESSKILIEILIRSLIPKSILFQKHFYFDL